MTWNFPYSQRSKIVKQALKAILAILMFCIGVAHATPIVTPSNNGHSTQGTEEGSIVISNWLFIYGGSQFEDGFGWIQDKDGIVPKFLVQYAKASSIDPLGSIVNWISPVNETEGSYTFSPIQLEYVLEDVFGDIYNSSIGKGVKFSDGTDPFRFGVEFSVVELEVTQITSTVSEPPSFSVLIVGLMLIGLAGQWRRVSARQY